VGVAVGLGFDTKDSDDISLKLRLFLR
jgi:hypothetical protein